MNVIPEDILVHFVDRDDFCYPEWRAISQKVKALELTEEQQPVLWRELVLTWLDRLQKKLGLPYTIYETRNFFLVANPAKKPMKDYFSFWKNPAQQ